MAMSLTARRRCPRTGPGRKALAGGAAGFGLLDAGDARDLVAAAARHPGTRWCLTVLRPDGTAAAHGCLPGPIRPPPGGPGTPPGIAAGPGPPGTEMAGARPGPPARLVPVARGRCGHGAAETGYRPSRALQHLIRARNQQCAAPGCGRPAARCDLDHTIAWDHGGLTCECDLAPSCKR
jgi:hypothetical protein